MIFPVSTANSLHRLLVPRRNSTNDRIKAKHIFVRIQFVTSLAGKFRFVAILSANVGIKCWHYRPIPPFAPSTSGVNVPCSTSIIR